MTTLALEFRATARQFGKYLKPAWVIPVALAAFLLLSIYESDYRYSFLAKLAIAGLGNGAIAALSGLGLILTYRTTGVFNFAQGAIATFCAYVFWSLTTNHGWPVWAGTIFAVGLLGPAIGVGSDVVLFRPLQRMQATVAEKIVASLGLTVFFIGICAGVWGFGTKYAKSPLPRSEHLPWTPFGQGYPISYTVIGDIVVVGVVSVALTVVFRFTRLGTEIRAVVDKRELAELTSVNANRISAIAWALGCGFAAFAGILYANTVTLDPYRTTLLILDTFAVAVIAKLRNMPAGVATGIIAGVAQALMQAYPHDWVHIKIQLNVLAILLIVFLFAYRDLAEVGDTATGRRGVVTGRLAGRSRLTQAKLLWGIVVGGGAVLLPLGLGPVHLQNAQEIVALSIAFLSIVGITGFSGNISLCQAGFAGLGAFLTAKFSTVGLWFIPHMPVIPAMLLGAALVVPVGILVGFPALRRKGLVLGLFTLAVGILLDAIIFSDDRYFDGFGQLHRPVLFGLNLKGGHAYYWFELVVLALMLFLVRNLRSGRLGRILAAMRDSETGTTSIGINLRTYKLFIFAISSFVAAIGGSLFMLSDLAFTQQDFSPLFGLFWFTAVVVAGLSYLSGAIIAAILFIGLDALFAREGISFFIIGLLALATPYLPGGLVGTFLRIRRGIIPPALAESYMAARSARAEEHRQIRARLAGIEEPEGVAEPPTFVASSLARDLILREEARS